MKSVLKSKLHCIIILLFFVSASSLAQAQPASLKDRTAKTDSVTPMRARWAIKTNTVDWLFLLPNIGAEFDLFRSPYKHYSINIHVKGNWFTPHKIPSKTVYDLNNARIEFRRYRRPTNRNRGGQDPNRNIADYLKEDVFSWQRNNPRYWRAYYLGGYFDASHYNMKFSETGHKGRSWGLGFTVGYGIPMYQYKHGALDFELGGSLGLIYTTYDSYTLNQTTNQYVSKGAMHRKILPMISDLRVAVVFRFESIKNKYKLIDYERLEQKSQEKKAKLLKKEEAKKLKQLEELKLDSIRHVLELEREQQDSLKAVKKAQKKQERKTRKAQKETQYNGNGVNQSDSIIRTDSLLLNQLDAYRQENDSSSVVSMLYLRGMCSEDEKTMRSLIS